MTSIEKEVINTSGIHTRLTSAFVRQANQYQSEIFVTCEGVKTNAKSIMGMLMLGIHAGNVLFIEADGPDETLALEGLTRFIDTGFGFE